MLLFICVASQVFSLTFVELLDLLSRLSYIPAFFRRNWRNGNDAKNDTFAIVHFFRMQHFVKTEQKIKVVSLSEH